MPLSDLQLGLAGLGAAFVAAVFAYNKWQERNLRQRAQRLAGASAEARAAASEEEGAAVQAGAPPDGRMEPVLDGPAEAQRADMAAASAPAAEMAPPPLELADPAIDCLVHLLPVQPIAAVAFWPAQRVHLGTLEARLRWLGQDAGTGAWRELAAADTASFARLCAALQLADRSGALADVQLSKFFIGVTQLAEDFQAEAELPKAADVLAQARLLDDFCASVDWRLAIHVVASAGAAAAAAAAIMDAAGLKLRQDGLFHFPAVGPSAFTVGRLSGEPADALSAGDGYIFVLDMPRAENPSAAYARMLEAARQLAAALPGEIVDEQRTPIQEHVLAAIGDKVAEFQQKMAEHDIPAGGRRALRLYS